MCQFGKAEFGQFDYTYIPGGISDLLGCTATVAGGEGTTPPGLPQVTIQQFVLRQKIGSTSG
jgi:hypothetical protein